MDRLKKIGIFVALLAVLGGGAVLLFWDLGAECRSILTSGAGEGNYLLTASDAEGGVYALGRTEKGYELVIGDLSGRRTQRWTLEDGTVPRDSTPAVLYPASGGAVYLGLYNTESGTRLQLYRLTNQGREAELLLDEACPGENLQEQMAGTRLSDFSEVDNVVTFALIQGDTAQFYQRTGSGSGLEARQETVQSGLRAALALSDGTLVLADGDSLIRTDGETVPLDQGELVLSLTQAGTGVYYVDGNGLQVYFADFADWQPYSYLTLEKDAYDLDACSDLHLTRDGDVLLLMEGRRLLLDRGSVVSDLSGMLYRPAAQCGLILAGMAAAVAAVNSAKESIEVPEIEDYNADQISSDIMSGNYESTALQPNSGAAGDYYSDNSYSSSDTINITVNGTNLSAEEIARAVSKEIATLKQARR